MLSHDLITIKKDCHLGVFCSLEILPILVEITVDYKQSLFSALGKSSEKNTRVSAEIAYRAET